MNAATNDEETTRRRNALRLVVILAVLVSFCTQLDIAKSAAVLMATTDDGPTNPAAQDGAAPSPPFKILRGSNWSAWDRLSVLHNDWGFDCRWANFTPKGQSEITAPMCVHPEYDLVSNRIFKFGWWHGCDLLPQIQDSRNPYRYHLEIGANIGACVMSVLLATNAEIVAFEPVPKNLFCLTSTLMGLDEALRRRVTLFPIGLGATPGTFPVYSAKGNFGNSVVGKKVGDVPWQAFEEPIPISVERADDLLDFSNYQEDGARDFPDVVMKMDTQGFECNVMRGMMDTCKRYVRKIFFEADDHWLNATDGCSKAILLDLMLECGLTKLTGPGDGLPLDPRVKLSKDLFAEKDERWKPGNSHL